MRLSHFLGIALLGVSTYLLLELLFGSYGVVAYRVVTDYVQEAEAQLVELRETHDELERLARRLSSDRETVRLEARDVGYIREDEVVVRVEGHQPRPRHRYYPGAIPVAPPPLQDNRPLFRAIALVVSLVALLVKTLLTTAGLESPHAGAPGTKRDEQWDIEVEGDQLHG